MIENGDRVLMMANNLTKAHSDKDQRLSNRKFSWGQCLKYEVDPKGEFIKKTKHLPKTCTNPDLKGSEIQEFFRNANVFITGATGFMGKILVEKILASCPNIGKLYVLIREKRGKNCNERLDELFKDDVFKRLHETVPKFREKIIVVNGDCSQTDLGLAPDDYKNLANNANIIFHGAATVRFDEKIKTAANINVRGVCEILKFARTCKHLKSIVHISTAYANAVPELSEINEIFYPPAYDYKKLLKLVDEVESDDELAKITNAIIAPWPNTYAFTKQIGEDVIKQKGPGLPIAIFRPAMVIATYLEPVRGWCDNIYGPTGVSVGAGTGVLRVLRGLPEASANIVPVDYAVNGLIAVAWKTHHNFIRENGNITPKVYNYTSTSRNPLTWKEYSHWNSIYGRKWPTMMSIWYPMIIVLRWSFLYYIAAFLLHTLPAYLVDGFLYITGQPTKLIKGYKKINKFCDVIGYYTVREWKFSDSNTLGLWNELSAQDKDIYPFDIGELDWDYYTQAHLLGLRVYLVKDPLETLPAARIKYKRLLVQHIIVLALVGFLCLWGLVKLIGWKL